MMKDPDVCPCFDLEDPRSTKFKTKTYYRFQNQEVICIPKCFRQFTKRLFNVFELSTMEIKINNPCNPKCRM